MLDDQMYQWLQWQWDAEEEELEALEVIERRHMRRARRVVPDRMNPFIAMTEEEFVDRFRLKKDSVNSIIQEIQDDLPIAHDRRGM